MGPSPDQQAVDDSRIMLLRKDSGEMIPSAPSGSVLLSSAPFGWRGIVLETHRLGPQELPEHLVQGHQLSVHTGRPLDFEYHSDGRWRRVKMFPGALSLVTNTAPSYPRWSEPYEFVKLSLDPTFVAKVLQDTAHSPSIAFPRPKATF